jgi:pyruvate/2-oxoglutarate dehydrogenase complex dihydrolipoamide dehydrogenase (E3) component
MVEPRPAGKVDKELMALVEPFDEHNQALISNVHPLDWVNPGPADRYHLVVIGAGTAGLVSAAGAAGLGARVALIERRLMGGDCLNYGCVPSKGIIRAARAWEEARQASERFSGPVTSGEGDFAGVMARMRRARAGISRHDSVHRFSELGIDVFLGDGRFVASDAIEVEGARLRFRRAIIATGARPVAPPIPGCDEGCYLTNETIFTLTKLPKRFGVIGGGPIGCELAQSFARLGSQVTLFDMAPHVLVREDSDAAAIVQNAMVEDGVHLELGVKVLEVEATSDERVIHIERKGDRAAVTVDELLVAVGRAPNVEGIGLEGAGVEFDRFGVKVNDRLQTSNKKVYAVGDVASKFKFTHTADALARIAIQNALLFGRKKASSLIVPWCTYTSPEVGHVGLYEKDASEKGIEIDTLTVPLADVDRAVLDGATDGFLRVHVEKGKDRILGATIVAENAGDILGELSLAVTNGVGLNKIANTIHAYPTQSEVVKRAADTWRRGKLTPGIKRVFDTFFRVFR